MVKHFKVCFGAALFALQVYLASDPKSQFQVCIVLGHSPLHFQVTELPRSLCLLIYAYLDFVMHAVYIALHVSLRLGPICCLYMMHAPTIPGVL